MHHALGLLAAGLFITGPVIASPLDDQITAFKDAPTQTEGAVSKILQTGLAEHRSARAFAAVKPWLAAHPSTSAELQFRAGQAAEYAGDWSSAVSFYRKLLKNPKVNAKFASEATPSVYRLLINHLGDAEAAYLFMKEDGDRLRQFGRAKQFDAWFLEQAQDRNDLAAIANRLAAIHHSNDPLDSYADSHAMLFRQLETFKYGNPSLFSALDNLVTAKRTTNHDKARIAWVQEIIPLAAVMAEKVGAREKIPDEIMDDALKAANTLIKVAPYEGSIAVAEGWMFFNAGDSGVFSRFVTPRREEKAAPILKALASLPPEQARDVLGRSFPGAKNRKLADYLLSKDELRTLVTQLPAVFNSLTAPDVPLFDKELTPETARAMAPHLARNPHAQAAMVRAWAKPERKYSAAADQMMSSEMWRFDDIKAVTHGLWHSGMFERDVENDEPNKKYAKLDARYQKLKTQVGKDANGRDRLAAFKALQQDLLSASPRIPGALPLWDELFTNAPDPDKVTMFKALAADLTGDREHLLRRAAANAPFGGQRYAILHFEPQLTENWNRWGRGPLIKALPALATHLQGILRKQMSGQLSEPILGMWLHCVDPTQPEARQFMATLSKSPAYAKINPDYHRLASNDILFGRIALTDVSGASHPHHVSRELLSLPQDAAPAQAEAALKTAVDRATKTPAGTTIIGLDQVASLPEWSAPTRRLVMSLFKENAPIGEYPTGQGYEPLIVRITQDNLKSKLWKPLEPYAAGLWQAAAYPDHPKSRGADALAALTEAMLKDDSPSLAASFSRAAQHGPAGRILFKNTGYGVPEIAARVNGVAGPAALAVGAVEIPVDETSPAYSIYKSNAEFVQGNLDSAWELYLKNPDQLEPVLRELSVDYAFWLLERNTNANRTDEAENLVKLLTIWSRQAEGTFSLEQEAELKIAYADLAFRKGALPTSRAWYRKVAEAAEYEGTEMHLNAALGSVMVDRVSKNFGAALTELDKLMTMKNPAFRMRVRYARAEVFMDQENYAEALGEIEAVLRQKPKHPDALILRGKVQYEMRKLVEASEIELGPSQDDTVIVPGEAVKINLRDPTLRVSGVGADIEVEIWAKSGDKERVLLHQLGDSKEKFRAEVPTALGPATPGDKVLQILGTDEIRFGYSKRFRAKMDDLPDDPDLVIGVASDAHLSFSAGAFPPRKGERRLAIEELGLSSAQAALGTRAVRPGNPVYLRVTDPDRSTTSGIDQLTVNLQSSSGDEIRQLVLQETAPFSGEFQGIVPTTGAQALAFASESAPGRDPNMAISRVDYPGWQGQVGDKNEARTFGVDLNDNVPLGAMTIDTGSAAQALTHFVLQTSMNGKDWTTRARYPASQEVAPWDGRPQLSSFPTYRGGMAVSEPEDRNLPEDWAEIMELTSARASINYLSAIVPNISADELPAVNTGHPGYSGLFRFRALFYQPEAAIRRFQLTGLPVADDKGNTRTIFLIDGQPAHEDSEDPMVIEREFAPGLHEIEVWRHEGRSDFLKRQPVLMCDVPGQLDLVPCPDDMFDPTTFPEGVRELIPKAAIITSTPEDTLSVQFGEGTRARLVRLVIQGFQGVAPTVRRVTLDAADGKVLLPVAQDYKALRQNTELEVLPGDQITARYEDPVTATPKRNRHEGRLSVAFNNAEITASFLEYEINRDGERELKLEPIRRFRFDDAVGIIIDDVDLDSSPKRDTVDFTVTTSEGHTVSLKAVETEEHSGRFMGRVFPIEGEPSRNSEIKMAKGGTLTAVYRDTENLDPGIPTDRSVTISHAQYAIPSLNTYALGSEALPPAPAIDTPGEAKGAPKKNRTPGPEIVPPKRALSYSHVSEGSNDGKKQDAVIGAPLCFDVVGPHLALAKSSEIHAYVQTEAARKTIDTNGKVFDVRVPGTLKLTGTLGGRSVEPPKGYTLENPPQAPTNAPPLEDGRFSFSVPLILGDPPTRSFATKSAADLPDSAIPDGLAVKAGDIVHVGFPWQDEEKNVHWKTASFTVGSHAFLDVMASGYTENLDSAYVGEKVYLRLLAPGLDQGPERDVTSVTLQGTSGTKTGYELKETEGHSGVFKGVFTVSYADKEPPAKLPPVALNGFPVRYGDDITVSYQDQSRTVNVNKGADGLIEPFTKRFTGDEMAVRTSFTLAECYFELAKKHREMEQESLARREIGHARKLLAEALATHRDDEIKAHAEYLLGNLAQEYADLAKNEEARLPMYQDALARFSKIPSDYPETEFASKAQFKTALVYEKMGEIENAVEEYVKLAYKYPDDELIPTVMARLGGYFQKKGMAYKQQADPLREKEDTESQAEVIRLDELSYPEFLNAAMVFAKLHERFPDDPLAGLAGLRAAQNYMRAHQYDEAIRTFETIVDNEQYDGRDIRSQALYWMGLSHERSAGLMSEGNYKGRGQAMNEAYEIYRRVTFDFPDSKWAKYARGRLADPVFAAIIERERKERERMIEALKESRK